MPSLLLKRKTKKLLADLFRFSLYNICFPFYLVCLFDLWIFSWSHFLFFPFTHFSLCDNATTTPPSRHVMCNAWTDETFRVDWKGQRQGKIILFHPISLLITTDWRYQLWFDVDIFWFLTTFLLNWSMSEGSEGIKILFSISMCIKGTKKESFKMTVHFRLHVYNDDVLFYLNSIPFQTSFACEQVI